ncbi:MAG TPA: gamma-glutamyltransferase [Kiloniellales bacterium]
MTRAKAQRARGARGPKGAVACGHEETAAAASEILADGGNAFDAALAAMCAAFVVEPVFCSPGGGGFLLASPAEGEALAYDFFVETPRRRRAARDIDFYPILADFGTATQEFHIGLGAVATPGVIKGLFDAHADLGSLPMTRLVAPAVRLAREGWRLRPIDHYVFRVVGPILTAREDSRGAYTRADGDLLHTGDVMRQPDLADCLEALAREGADLFYAGDMGDALVAACREGGGQLTRQDLALYRVERRRPLARDYRGARILTNPPPSCGGILIAFALEMLRQREPGPLGFGSGDHLALLTNVMALTNRARLESRLHEALDEREEASAAARLFDPGLVRSYADEVRGRPACERGTTHISVIDANGNVAALSLSNGEGCGYVLPGTGIMLNNMLGEEDLNVAGFNAWHAGTRMASMMAPTLAFMADGGVAALGSGGSNRIRTAILQVLSNLIDFARPAEEAVTAPRIHFENGLLSIEGGYAEETNRAVAALVGDLCHQIMVWPEHNLFFGGVHTATRDAGGRFAAGGDPRRGGAVAIL